MALNGNFEIIDSNADNVTAQKRHADAYMQCEEADRSLRFIGQYLKQVTDVNGVSILPSKPSYDVFRSNVPNLNLNKTALHIKEADEQLHEKIRIFDEMKSQQRQRQVELAALNFYKTVVQDHNQPNTIDVSNDLSSIEMTILDDDIISSVTGFAPSDRIMKLLTMVFRVSRKNVAYHIGESDGENTPYSIFTSSQTILTKITKICESFSPDVFQFNDSQAQISKREMALEQDIQQMASVQAQALQDNQSFLNELAQHFWTWKLFITQEKQVQLYLDYGDFERFDSSVVYSCWVPHRLLPQLHPIIGNATTESGSAVTIQLNSISAEEIIANNNKLPIDDQKEIVIPTFIERNDFSYAFQLLNDSYGVPNYDEINGGAFYCMYPMLFAVMFGDIGHAFFFVLASLTIFVLAKKKVDLGDMGATIFRLKYLLLFASFCALYCGFIYNECFGLPIYMFKTSYKSHITSQGLEVWNMTSSSIYPFGIDPTWFFKDNELIFLNSYKMKLSVILGMCQMIFGMFLQLINHIHRKDYKSIFIKWIPEMLYLVPFFGYLVVLIIKKWCTHFQGNNDFSVDIQNNGINLIQMMISMILNIGQKDPDLQLYKQQWSIQMVIVVIFFISIPYLLFAKPICECIRLKGSKHFSVLEIFVMNLISVIEFCLGALSHTASYLRLWALSLAHSQLSHVIYEQALVQTINSGNFVIVFAGFAAFAALSVAILLGMEAFSALLHAIRLMWVEFSSKFYEGMGVAFKPISLEREIRHIIV